MKQKRSLFFEGQREQQYGGKQTLRHSTLKKVSAERIQQFLKEECLDSVESSSVARETLSHFDKEMNTTDSTLCTEEIADNRENGQLGDLQDLRAEGRWKHCPLRGPEQVPVVT